MQSSRVVSDIQATKQQELTKQYWQLREAIRYEEGKYDAVSQLILLLHNASWMDKAPGDSHQLSTDALLSFDANFHLEMATQQPRHCIRSSEELLHWEPEEAQFSTQPTISPRCSFDRFAAARIVL